MPFNTAIFYDIENLLKGYSFSQQMATNFSLKEFVDAVKATNKIDQIAVQRAYANWSDPRLAIMRGQINEMGIDPIQVFGFSRDQKKNAADIQLAIDTIDLAHLRPAIDVFVIISGDGGFASLAKKLHEYGKTVIGCAYRSATNKTFHSVCDAFVWMTDPEEEERPERPVPTQPNGILPVSDPRNAGIVSKIKRCASMNPEEVLAKAKEILNLYANEHSFKAGFADSGIYLSVIQELVKYAIPNFQATRFGFTKFIEYLQYACTGTELCVARRSDQPILIRRTAIPSGTEVLPDIFPKDLQNSDSYRNLLTIGSPVIRLTSVGELQTMLEWIAQHPPEQADLGSIIEDMVTGLDNSISSESVKNTVLSLNATDTFQREPEGSQLSEQKLTLQSKLRTSDALLTHLENAGRNKLTLMLGTLQEDILYQLFRSRV